MTNLLTEEECRFLYILQTTPFKELEELFIKAGLSEEEIESFKKILEE